MHSFLASIPLLSCFEILAAALVAVGCVGELILIFQKAPLNEEELKTFEKKKHVRERIFVCMVAVGVTMELIMVPISIHETAQLFKEVAQANERTANVESTNAMLSLRVGEAMRQAEELKVLSSSNELARARIEWQLAQVRSEQSPRAFKLLKNGGRLDELLKGKVTGECAISYMPDDIEAHLFAINIMGRLSLAGWKILGIPEPIPSDATASALRGIDPAELKKLPLMIRATGSAASISIVSRINASADDETNPASVLASALFKCGFKSDLSSFWNETDATFPSNKVLLIIGPKP